LITIDAAKISDAARCAAATGENNHRAKGERK
jgi:hypothetical protein